jgi:antitoxin (DNA-binding transcriptional repressor) of toxin-antitoxin stability system
MAEPLPSIGIDEFRECTRQYLAEVEPIAITQRGRVIGFYVPIPRNEEEIDRALKRLAESVERIRRRTGMSEDELVDFFDARKPSPE